MSKAFSWLTGRGAAFLGVAAFAAILAGIMGRKDLLTLALFLTLLPCACGLLMKLGPSKITATREFTPGVVPVRSSATVDLSVTSPKTISRRIRMQESLPHRFGSAPQFWFPGRSQSMGSGGQPTSRYQYSLHSGQRGVFPVGPARAEMIDVFGLTKHRIVVPGTAMLTVTPALSELPELSILGARSLEGSAPTAQRANPSDDDAMTREYRHGDPMRRVHWAATARHQQLMVRQEESATTPEAMLVLDSTALAYESPGGVPFTQH